MTVVELDATTLQGETLYALGIGDAVWVADTASANDSGIILPVNEAARTYDPSPAWMLTCSSRPMRMRRRKPKGH